MTISYNLDVASASPLNFFRLIFRWKASIWKICLKELLVWTIAFLLITFVYRTPYFLNDYQKTVFEQLAVYFDSHLKYIPLTFMLGFFVQIIVKRWSILFQNMGYVESSALYIGGYVYGADDECRLLRRTMARYLCLTQLLVYRDISVRVRKRFPTYDSIIQAGFMLEHEKEKIESVKLNFNKYWVPVNWIYALIFRARADGKIISDSFTNKLCDHLKLFRNNLQMLCNYDWVPIPLAYPQLVFLAVYVYFAICLISRQFIVNKEAASKTSDVDLTLPFVTMMEFLIFVGWMKVAEGLLNPFGEDDDDFECNFLLDKNLATALCIVDEASNDAPELAKDQFWSTKEIEPIYSKESAAETINPLVGSATLSNISGEVDQGTRMVVRKSIDISNGTSSIQHSPSGRTSRKWRLGSIVDRFGSMRRSKLTRSTPKLSFDDRSFRQMEDGSKTVDSLGSKKHLRRISAFGVLEGPRTCSDISTIYEEMIKPTSQKDFSKNLKATFHKERIVFGRSFSDSGHDLSIPATSSLSTVEEEDPNNLTVSRTEEPRTNIADYFGLHKGSTNNIQLMTEIEETTEEEDNKNGAEDEAERKNESSKPYKSGDGNKSQIEHGSSILGTIKQSGETTKKGDPDGSDDNDGENTHTDQPVFIKTYYL